MQPFGEQAVPFGQQPPPTSCSHSKVSFGHFGGYVADAWHSLSEALELQQNVPDVL
jgi:hypothetical protein